MTTLTRKPGSERRREIAIAVLRIIGEEGLPALTTSALAKQVGVTSGALFRHFSSREAMLEEAVLYGLAQIEKTFPARSLPPVERLLGLARNRVHLLTSDPGISWLLRSSQTHLVLPQRAVAKLSDVVVRSKRYLLEALTEGVSEGSIREDIQPEVLLVLVMGTIHALAGMPGVHRMASRDSAGNPERVLEGLKTMLSPTSGDERNKPMPRERR